MFKETTQGIFFAVKVSAKASKSEIIGWENEELKIRVAAVREKGEANRELIRFLAKLLSIAKSRVLIISGETSPHKRICIVGVPLDVLRTCLCG